MRISTPGLACTGFAALLLSGCGGGGGGGSSNPPPPAPAPTLTFTGTPTDITTGGGTTLTWSTTNASGCTASDGWTGAKSANGTEQITSIQATTTYTLTCASSTAGGGSTAPRSVVVTVTAPPAGTQTANAGLGRTVIAGSTVRLSGEASVDPEGDALQYTWTQTGGTAVTLTGANTVNPTFTAPSVTSNTALTFSLNVTDGASAASAPSTVTITIAPLGAGNVLVKGRITYVRIPFFAALNQGLNFAAPVNRPARGIVVAANSAGTATQLASGDTDSDGNFALAVAQNTPIDLVAVSRLSRDNGVPLPRWSFTAVDADTSTTTPYTFTDGAFNSSTGVTHDMNIPSGLNAAGTATGTRASAPFAVLDTIYTALQAVVGVAPTTDFPTLLLDWAGTNPGGETFFDPGNGGSIPQKIVLSATLAEDTDEFDPHVIAHEFGHYIEHNFSRADNIGGSHGIGDKLDIRVAFGEGFGYAFAAIALKDPVARDSFVNNNQQVSSTFNVETNPSTNPPGSPSGNVGCWCSESSVWSLLWDMYDGTADANDTVALGFKPMWDVLTGAQRTTPAFTSIFSFTTAVRAAQSSQGTAIDTLVTAQNITAAGMDAFGSTETHVPTPVASAAALPVYTTLTAGTPVTLRSVDDAGHYNTLGNHRFARYVKSGSASQTVTVTTTGTDPDVIVYRNGNFVQAAESSGNESFTITTAGTYLFDVYECSNGCASDQGTPGDYDVTVTVN